MFSRLKLHVLSLAFILLFCPAGMSEPFPPEAGNSKSIEEKYLTSEHLKSGNFPALVDEWLDYAGQNPAAPFTELILRSLNSLADYLPDNTTLINRLEKISQANLMRGFNGFLLKKTLLALYTDRGNYKLSLPILGGDKPLTDINQSTLRLPQEIPGLTNWAVIGPFGFTPRAVFYERFPPEITTSASGGREEEGTGIDFTTSITNEQRTLTWRVLPTPSDDQPVNFFTYSRPVIGAIYGLCQIKSSADRSGYLVISTAASFKLWFNHTPIFTADRMCTTLPEEFILPIKLNAGWNQFLIKTIAGGATEFQIHLVNENWEPLNLETEKALVLHPLNASGPDTPATVIDAVFSPAWTYYQVHSFDPFAQITMGLLDYQIADGDRAVAQLEKVVRMNPSPFTLYYLAQAYDKTPLPLASYRQTRVLELVEKILALAPDFVPAYLLRVKYYQAQGKMEEALLDLKKVLQINPRCGYACLLAADIARRLGWDTDAASFWKAAAEIAPQSPGVRAFQADTAALNGNYDLARTIYTQLVKEQPARIDSLIALDRETGRLNEVTTYYRSLLTAQPNNPRLREELTAVYRSQNSPEANENARKEYETLSRLIPQENNYLKALGDLYQKMGQSAKAVRLYQTALQNQPGDASLRRYLAYLAKDETDFAREFYINVPPLLPLAPGAAEFPNANCLYLADQGIVRIYEDGSHTEVIHEAIKILTYEGVLKYSTIEVMGDLLEARLYLPNGRILEPSRVGGQRLTLPGVCENSVIEYTFRQDFPRPEFQFSFPKFYFQDFLFDAPYLVSQLVVITPKDFPLIHIERNFQTPARVTTRDNLKVYDWTFKMTERLEPEPLMPHINEVLPNVELGAGGRTWDDVVQLYRDNYLGRTLVTVPLKETVRQVLRENDCLTGTVRQKAAALYYFVNDLVKDTTDGESNEAQSILLTRQGNRLLLLKGLLSAAGIPNYLVLVCQPPSRAPKPEWNYPNPDYFIDRDTTAGGLLMIIQEDKSPLWACGDYPYLIFGDLPDYVQGGRGLVIPDDPETGRTLPQFVTIPQLPLPGQSPTSDITLFLQTGVVTGTGKIMAAGQANHDLKNNFLLKDARERPQELERILNSSYPGLVLESADFPHLTKPRQPLEITFRFNIPQFVTSAGEEWKCPIGLPPLQLTHAYSSAADRSFPLVLRDPIYQRNTRRLVLPPDAQFVWTPPDTHLSTAFGTYDLTITRTDGTLLLERTFHLPAQRILPADYPNFIKFCGEIERLESRPIRFRQELPTPQ